MTTALEGVEKPKVAGFVDAGFNSKNQTRIAREEKELQELLNQVNSPEAEMVVVETAPKEEAPLNKEEESFKKRYGDLRRHMADKEKEWEAKFATLQAPKSNVIVPPKSDEDIEAWIKKYPDVAGIVTALVEKRMQDTKQSVKELENLRWEAKRETAEAEIRKVHGDFDNLKEADEFHDWVDEQPKWVQDALFEQSEDPRAVIRVLDLYKSDKGLTSKSQKDDARKAAGFVKTSAKTSVNTDDGQYLFSESQVQKMKDKEYSEKENKIMEAIRTGKFLYDVSGAAR